MPKQHRPHTMAVELPGFLWPKLKKHLDHVLSTLPNAHGFKGEYLREEIYSKFMDPKLHPPQERRSAAKTKWLKTEQKNIRVNRHLMLFEGNLGWTEYETLKSRIRKIISGILGPVPLWSELDPEVTNGASTRVRRSPSASVDKLTGELHITSSAVKHWEEFARDNILAALPIKTVAGSVFFTVPKKSDIDRVACKEPEANMILQRMLGVHMRNRLRRVGIDLTDQGLNQSLARDALKANLATIDLSSASDSISRQVVMELLPAPWWSVLDDLRVTHTLIDKEWHELAMFSSMGNGFTFELETILFYAITRAVCWLSGIKGKITVYGDDIIAPSAVVPRLQRVFSLFGFSMNPKKTHYKGPFRESCGKHYHSGVDVSPFYIRKAVETVPELILLLNHLLEWDGRGWGFFLNKEPYEFWLKWRKYVPKDLWGGIDPSDPSALVTGDRPRKRLIPVTRDLKRDELGAARLWLLRTQSRATHKVDHFDVTRFCSLGRRSRASYLRSYCTQHAELFSIDPKLEIGFTTQPLISAGERTTWLPDLIW